MEAVLAEHAGFCFGVRRAVELLEKELAAPDRERPIFTWGPIIHNEEVVRSFEERGARAAASLEELAAEAPGGQGLVVLRAHGVPRETQRALEEGGYEVVDATCPFVKRIHGIVREAAAEGRYVLVVGDPEHPEVRGIVSWAEGAPGARVIQTPAEAEASDLPAGSRVTLVSQTTFHVTKLKEIVEIIRKKEYDVNIADTVCNATEERQREAAALASWVDAMIVAGSASSSNTRKLYEICREACPLTYFIHTPQDLPERFPEGVRRIGITAGASTPQRIIEEVVKYVRSGQEFHGVGGRIVQDDPHGRDREGHGHRRQTG